MTLDAKKLTNWRYWRCPLDAESESFGPFRDIVALWNARRLDQNALPRRRDLDFFDFAGWWGKISIARIERDPFDVRFVLWGTHLSDWWGVDYTDKRLGSASITPEAWAMVEGRYFKTMDDDPFIGLVCGYLDQHERPHIKILGVDLPLSDEAGGPGLSHVLSVHVEIDVDETPENFLPDCPATEFD